MYAQMGEGGGGGQAKITYTYCLKRYILLYKCVHGVRGGGGGRGVILSVCTLWAIP